MSEMNKDQEVVQKGRKNALQGVEASLRDQIPAKLMKKLKELDVGRTVQKLWYQGNADRAEWLQRQQTYLQSWDEFLVASDDGAFKGSSNLHIPMPFIVSKTMHARFLQALLGIDPPFTVRPRTSGTAEQAPMVQEVMEYAIKDWSNSNEGCYEVLDLWVWQWLTTGSGLLKLRWDCEYTRFIDVEIVDVPTVPKSVVDENGIETLVPQTKKKEKEVVRTKTKFEGPVFDCLFNEDFLMIGGQGNPQKADACIQREMMTASQLWTLVDRKVFDASAVEEIIRQGRDAQNTTVNGDIKYQRAINSGKSQIESSAELDRYEIMESYLKLDVDGSGITSDVVVWSHLRSGELLKGTYLHRMNKSGERPYFKIDFHKRQGQDYGIGIVEILYPLSVEMDAIHNMRIDFGLISVMPFGFYRPTSSIDPVAIQIEPGMLIPVDNPQSDVYFPNLGNRTAFGFQEEQALQTLVERLTGISDLSLGLIGGQGAARTATGARALLGEANANLDVHLRRLNLGWKKALDFLLHMLQQRLPDGFAFRLTGEDGGNYWAQVAQRDDIGGDFDFEVNANSSTSNKQIQQENANQVLQMTGNPLDIQLGIVGPSERYEALKFWYSSYGMKDFGKFAKRPQDFRVYSPEEEVNRILTGIETKVTMQSDHQGFLDYYQHIISEPTLLGMYSQDDVLKLRNQAIQHQQMLEAVQQMQAQQRNAQQMQQNAAMSQQQAPTGLNPLAGNPGPNGVPTGGGQ